MNCMKSFVLFVVLLSMFTLTGCPAPVVVPTDGSGTTTPVTTPLEKAQDVATKSVISVGEVMLVAPNFLRGLRQMDKLSKVDYNNAVDIYNQALASYTLLNQALQAAIKGGMDPSASTGYTNAMATFMSDRKLLDNIIAALGGIK